MDELKINLKMLDAAIRYREKKEVFRIGRWPAGNLTAFSPDGTHAHIFPTEWNHIQRPFGAPEFNWRRVYRESQWPCVPLTATGRVKNRGCRGRLLEYRSAQGSSIWLNAKLLKEFSPYERLTSAGSPLAPVFVYRSSALVGIICPEKIEEV